MSCLTPTKRLPPDLARRPMAPLWRPGEPLIALPGYHKARSVCRRCGRPIYAMGIDGEFDIDCGDGAGEWLLNDDGEFEICGDCRGYEIGNDCTYCDTGTTPAVLRIVVSGVSWDSGCIGEGNSARGNVPYAVNGTFLLTQGEGNERCWYLLESNISAGFSAWQGSPSCSGPADYWRTATLKTFSARFDLYPGFINVGMVATGTGGMASFVGGTAISDCVGPWVVTNTLVRLGTINSLYAGSGGTMTITPV